MRKFNINRNRQHPQEKGVHIGILNDLNLQTEVDYERVKLIYKENANNIQTGHIIRLQCANENATKGG